MIYMTPLLVSLSRQKYKDLERLDGFPQQEIGQKTGRDRFQGCRNGGPRRADVIDAHKEEAKRCVWAQKTWS